MENPGTFNFNDFYQQYYKKTFLFAKSYVNDCWTAEDIASESLISLWEIMKKNDIHNPLAFLFSIAKNKSIDYLRHRLMQKEALENLSEVGLRELQTRISTLEACDPEKIFSDEVQTIIEQTLQHLPERTRDIFLMSRYKGLSKSEIAYTFGISIKGVEYHLAKALKQLRIQLKDYLPVLYILLFNNY